MSDNGGEPLLAHRALVSNTPFAGWKVSQWEGGTATPLIAWWPGQVPANALNLRHEVRLEDFMATFLEIAGLPYPTEFQNRKLFPLQGRSFLAALKNPNHAGPPRIWCWDHDGQRGIWAAPWKALFTEHRHPIHANNTPRDFAGWCFSSWISIASKKTTWRGSIPMSSSACWVCGRNGRTVWAGNPAHVSLCSRATAPIQLGTKSRHL